MRTLMLEIAAIAAILFLDVPGRISEAKKEWELLDGVSCEQSALARKLPLSS